MYITYSGSKSRIHMIPKPKWLNVLQCQMTTKFYVIVYPTFIKTVKSKYLYAHIHTIHDHLYRTSYNNIAFCAISFLSLTLVPASCSCECLDPQTMLPHETTSQWETESTLNTCVYVCVCRWNQCEEMEMKWNIMILLICLIRAFDSKIFYP